MNRLLAATERFTAIWTTFTRRPFSSDVCAQARELKCLEEVMLLCSGLKSVRQVSNAYTTCNLKHSSTKCELHTLSLMSEENGSHLDKVYCNIF